MVEHASNTEKRLEAAELRLAKAVGVLELALDKSPNPEVQAPSDLVDEISRLQTENLELKSIVEQTSTRLDATILKLKAQMGDPAQGQG